jgi:hypothetical protein
MHKKQAKRMLAIFVALVVMGFATAALVHGHFPGNSQEDSHCAICMAIHSGHAIASVVVALPFTLIWCAFLAGHAQIADSLGQFLAMHGRAPPLL